MSCPGKIARLPRSLREELNRRLERNVPTRLLVEWLNRLPEVQEILRDFFNGSPVSEQNICNWRRSGFVEWQTRQDFLEHLRDFAADAAEIDAAAPSMADHAANLLSLHFAVTLRENTLPPNPRPAKPEPKTGPEARTASERDQSPGRGDSIDRPPNNAANLFVVRTEGAAPSQRAHPRTANSPLSALKPLLAITRAVSSLRRGNQAAARLKARQSTIRTRASSVPPKPANQAKSSHQNPIRPVHPSLPSLTPAFSLTPSLPAQPSACDDFFTFP